MGLLTDGEAVYREWRRIVTQFGVSGVPVHDARLAAAMYVHRADVTVIEGDSYRVRESEQEAAARRRKK